MSDGFGNPKFIYNPYTYEELSAQLRGKVDPYLECISMRGQLDATVDSEANNFSAFFDGKAMEECYKIRPYVAALSDQQVSPIAVLERCKSNYQQKQWDVGAFLLYDAARAAETVQMDYNLPVMPADDPVGKCLLRAERNRESNLACMSDYLSGRYAAESRSEVYWRYEKVHYKSDGKKSGSDDVDACIVFSGPAKKNDSSLTTEEFRKCSHDYTDTGCVIPHMVWSSSSQNRVPVATLHTVEESTAEDREETALAKFAEARDMVMKALKKLENFTDSNLEVVLFSGEGDSLHQVLSAAMKMDLGCMQNLNAFLIFADLRPHRVFCCAICKT